ncbi:MAG: SRPBCC family protein [Saprospiraceae bacterium]
MVDDYFIDPDISRAQTLPSSVYQQKEEWEKLRSLLFLPSWQWLGGAEWLNTAHNLKPTTFLPGYIDEPLLIVREDNSLSCVSNVCTHRGNILIEESCQKSRIICGYHGRCFSLNGQLRSMPEFEEVVNFPSTKDHLTHYFLSTWNGLHFVALNPKLELTSILKPIENHLKSFPFDLLSLISSLSKTYRVKANWLAYCDNYLEGFHIPYVHPTLNKTIQYEDYEVRTFDHCVVQIARSKPGEPSINLQESDPDFGQNIYAYYWFVYPNIMLNFYHWGLSVNWVIPIGLDQTEVRFMTYKRNDIDDQSFLDTALDATEMEDENVVENVQKGLQSFAYNRGRYSVRREQGVHAFHRYLYEQVFREK